MLRRALIVAALWLLPVGAFAQSIGLSNQPTHFLASSIGQEIGDAVPGQPTIPLIVQAGIGTVGIKPLNLGQNIKANSLPVTMAWDQGPIPVSGGVSLVNSAGTAIGSLTNGAGKTGFFTNDINANKCYVSGQQNPTSGINSAVINVTANTKLITGVAGKSTSICHLNLVVGAADNVAIVEGTGSTCATSTAGIFGGTTAATGWNLAANGGIVLGNGVGVVGLTATPGDDVCIFVSAAAQASGNIIYAQF